MLQYYLSRLIMKLRLSSIKNSKIHYTSKIESGCQIVNTTMGRFSFCGYNCEIINTYIGSFCSIANNVKIGGAMHPIDWVSTSPVFYYGRDSVKKKFSTHVRPSDKTTYIGSDVWIGQNALIKQGINIGTGAVIGMGAVVTNDVSPYSIVVGNPAREIRKRYSEDIIKKMLDSKWWEFDYVKLKHLAQYIQTPDRFLVESDNYGQD